jgi:VWFA-related protein
VWATPVQQRPTFREAVDVIEFPVTVVTTNGTPVLGLGTDKFQVTIDGKIRRVVSADLVRYDQPKPEAAPAAAAPPSVAVWPDAVRLRTSVSDSRTFVLVIDASTFNPASGSDVTQAARRFIGGLQPADMVGLFVFPNGAQIAPTTDRKSILTALEKVNVHAYQSISNFNLRPSEVIELSPILWPQPPATSWCSTPWRRLMAAICDPASSCSTATIPDNCSTQLVHEVRILVNENEHDATTSFSLLQSLIAALADVAGHKTLVLLSGGITTTHRGDRRPFIGNLDAAIGEEATRANTTIYTLFVDWRVNSQNTADQRRPRRNLTPLSADSDALSRSLDMFTGASGGGFFKSLTGDADFFFNRVSSETSAYYVLGVAPDPKDADGKPHELKVNVKQSGVTVRGGQWVTVDRKPASTK